MNLGILKRILIIDDDLDLLMLLERRLLGEGYLIETAASLPEAEDILPDYNPHLLLLDINLKGSDGRTLSYRLKNEQPDVKVLILTGYDYNIGRAKLFGADDIIPKPLNMDYLLHRIESMLFQNSFSD